MNEQQLTRINNLKYISQERFQVKIEYTSSRVNYDDTVYGVVGGPDTEPFQTNDLEEAYRELSYRLSCSEPCKNTIIEIIRFTRDKDGALQMDTIERVAKIDTATLKFILKRVNE